MVDQSIQKRMLENEAKALREKQQYTAAEIKALDEEKRIVEAENEDHGKHIERLEAEISEKKVELSEGEAKLLGIGAHRQRVWEKQQKYENDQKQVDQALKNITKRKADVSVVSGPDKKRPKTALEASTAMLGPANRSSVGSVNAAPPKTPLQSARERAWAGYWAEPNFNKK